MGNVHMPLLKWSKIKIDIDKDMNGKSLINLNEVVANKLNGYNTKYDNDLDGILDTSVVPNLAFSHLIESQEIFVEAHHEKELCSINGWGFVKIKVMGDGNNSSFEIRIYCDNNLTANFNATSEGEGFFVFKESLRITCYDNNASNIYAKTSTIEIGGLVCEI